MSSIQTPLDAFSWACSVATDAIAIVQGKNHWTIADLDRMSDRITPLLRANDVARQTGVVISAPNSPIIAATAIAAWKIGAFPVFVSPHAPAGHLRRAEVLTSSRFILTDPALELPVRPLVPSNLIPVLPHEVASVVFTSGSTGEPKGVMQSAANLLSGAQRVGRLNEYRAERILCPVPFSHDYGWGQLLSCICLGQTLILPEHEGVQAMCDAIARHSPTVIAGTPAIYSGMVYGISDISKIDRTSVLKATSTGSYLSPELVDELVKLFPRVTIFANYGLSETYRSSCLVPSERTGREVGVGRAIEGVRLIVVDEIGRPLPPGCSGEVVHLGAGVAMGYIADPERSARTFRDFEIDGRQYHGVLTGDIGTLDADGFLTLTGRRDRLIKTMDVGISLDDVEKVLTRSQMIERIAAIDVPDRLLGQKIVVYIILREPATLSEVRVYARQNLSKYMIPRTYHIVDSLPSTPSGKIDYPKLKVMANAS